MDIHVSPQIERLIRDALDEDIGAGDLATMATISADARGKGLFRAKKDGVVAGLVLLDRIFYFIDHRVEVRLLVKDGTAVKSGTVVAEAIGPVRALLLGERTALINQLRGLLAEYGVVLPQGASHVRSKLPALLENSSESLPPLAIELFRDLYEELVQLDQRIGVCDRRVERLYRGNSVCQRLGRLEGIGALTATAFVATVAHAAQFKNGRQCAAWLGLTPRQDSTGGKPRLLGITKRGDVYLRTLLVHGARSAMRHSAKRDDPKSRWVEQLRRRRGDNVAACALAAKHARILWALMVREEGSHPEGQAAYTDARHT